MIVYSGTRSRFNEDVLSNDICDILHSAFQGAIGHGIKCSESNSCANSLMCMRNVIEDNKTTVTDERINPYHCAYPHNLYAL